ncbi:MAG: hypothetical protein LQ337_006100, partial [Flavoplaca oasis]
VMGPIPAGSTLSKFVPFLGRGRDSELMLWDVVFETELVGIKGVEKEGKKEEL